MRPDHLTQEGVCTVARDPDFEIEQSGGRVEFHRMMNDGRFVVVVVESDGVTVVTAWQDVRRSRRQDRRRDRWS
ncbi:MAG: hypothetical protein IT306_28710 [Chloroflexi bacterium]|nr:hypothetical protein [Chloroflexota bacterium]